MISGARTVEPTASGGGARKAGISWSSVGEDAPSAAVDELDAEDLPGEVARVANVAAAISGDEWLDASPSSSGNIGSSVVASADFMRLILGVLSAANLPIAWTFASLSLLFDAPSRLSRG